MITSVVVLFTYMLLSFFNLYVFYFFSFFKKIRNYYFLFTRFIYISVLNYIAVLILLNYVFYNNFFYCNNVSVIYYIISLVYIIMLYFFFFFNKFKILLPLIFLAMYSCFNVVVLLNDIIPIFLWFEVLNYILLTLLFHYYSRSYKNYNSMSIFYVILLNFFTTTLILFFIIQLLYKFGTTNLHLLNVIFENNRSNSAEFFFIILLLKLGCSPVYFINTYIYKLIPIDYLVFYNIIGFFYIIFFINFINFYMTNWHLLYLIMFYFFFIFKSCSGYSHNYYELIVISSLFFFIQFIIFILYNLLNIKNDYYFFLKKKYKFFNFFFINSYLNMFVKRGKSKFFKKYFINIYYYYCKFIFKKFNKKIIDKLDNLINKFVSGKTYNVFFSIIKNKVFVNHRKSYIYNITFCILTTKKRGLFFLKFSKYFFKKKKWKSNIRAFMYYNLKSKKSVIHKVYRTAFDSIVLGN